MTRWPPERIVDGSGLALPEWATMVASLIAEGRLDVLVAELRNGLMPSYAATACLSVSDGTPQDIQDRIASGIEKMLALAKALAVVAHRQDRARAEVEDPKEST